MNRSKLLVAVFLLMTVLAGCGGSGGSSQSAGVEQSAQKTWVRNHLDDVYLWYDEIVDVPAANYSLASDYFTALLVRSKDRFSYTMPQATAESIYQAGQETGFGVRFGWAAAGRLFTYYVDPNSPVAGLITRGTEILSINGAAVAQMSTSALNAALFPSRTGAATAMVTRLPGTNTTRSITLVSSSFAITTVAQPSILSLQNGGKAGYLLFNDHFLTSEQPLIDAMAYFKQQGVSEVVLDLRYNGGGYLFIAREVASMLGGAAVQGKVFEKLLFNNKHPEKTNNPDNTYLFSALARNGAVLPQLALSRVFVLTSSHTCSASEAIINGLAPFVEVIRIGTTTCGKPYGFVQANHDQQSYFAIQSEGVNSNGLDNYKTGFYPTCQVSDDLNYPLGDIREARLNTALYYMNNNVCPATPNVSLPKSVMSDNAIVNADDQLIGQKPSLKILH
jgi:C-terminal processing protease CtpA/Prc